MKLTILAILAACMIQASPATAWDTKDTALQTVVSAAMVADWMQTRDIVRHPDRFKETNLILGSHPHKDQVDAYFAACLIGHAAISYLLPDEGPYRNIWQAIWIGAEINQVVRNAKIGIRIQF